MKAKLHQLLAVENSLEGQANKTRAELTNTFEKKRHLLESKVTTFTPFGEGESSTESQSDIQTTVAKELKWVSGFILKALDASYQVAEANTQARADIVLEDGTTLITGVPATSLLELEKRMTEIQALVTAIPTLDPAKGFSQDPNGEKGVFQARQVNKTRTKKDKVVMVLYAATAEHPAQVQLVDKDIPTGTVSEQEWSSMLTPAVKAELINRVEVLSRAIRSARAKANETEVDVEKKIGAKLLNYVFQPVAV